jgi:hypothetical protein
MSCVELSSATFGFPMKSRGQDTRSSSRIDFIMNSQRPSRPHSAAWCSVPEVSDASTITVASDAISFREVSLERAFADSEGRQQEVLVIDLFLQMDILGGIGPIQGRPDHGDC